MMLDSGDGRGLTFIAMSGILSIHMTTALEDAKL